MKNRNSQSGYVAMMDLDNLPAVQASIFSAIARKISDFFIRVEHSPAQPPQYLFGKLANEEKLRMGFYTFL